MVGGETFFHIKLRVVFCDLLLIFSTTKNQYVLQRRLISSEVLNINYLTKSQSWSDLEPGIQSRCPNSHCRGLLAEPCHLVPLLIILKMNLVYVCTCSGSSWLQRMKQSQWEPRGSVATAPLNKQIPAAI